MNEWTTTTSSMATKRCANLEYYQRKQPDKIPYLCQCLEPPVIDKYLCNRKIKLTPLILPPHEKREDSICCQFELRIPNG